MACWLAFRVRGISRRRNASCNTYPVRYICRPNRRRDLPRSTRTVRLFDPPCTCPCTPWPATYIPLCHPRRLIPSFANVRPQTMSVPRAFLSLVVCLSFVYILHICECTLRVGWLARASCSFASLGRARGWRAEMWITWKSFAL